MSSGGKKRAREEPLHEKDAALQKAGGKKRAREEPLHEKDAALQKAGGAPATVCQICFEEMCTAKDAEFRTAFLPCGHGYCWACLVQTSKQRQPTCPSCRAPFYSEADIRLPERADLEASATEEFALKIKTLTGGYLDVRGCTAATTVESIKVKYAQQSRDQTGWVFGIEHFKLVWGRTELVNGNTLASYGINDARQVVSADGVADAPREIHVVSRAYNYLDPQVAARLGCLPKSPTGPLTIKVRTLDGRSFPIHGLSADTEFRELAVEFAKHPWCVERQVTADDMRFLFASINFPDKATMGDARLGARGYDTCHLILKGGAYRRCLSGHKRAPQSA